MRRAGIGEQRARAREAIAEMAPAFLEEIILGFANDPETANLAVEGLGQIPTPTSRADLVQLFDKSADLRLRVLIVDKLARIGTREESAFFSSLLSGRSTGLDDQIHIFAALGLGRLGGEEAVKALENGPQSPNPEVRAAVVVALGNTKSRAAIQVLTQMYADPDGRVQNDVCAAFATLTHYQWCDGGGTVTETQARWREWWRRHASQLTLYGLDQCPEFGASWPVVK